ncbi:MAG: hypothetical protein WBR18_10880 [Anaerolineales bacterium]
MKIARWAFLGAGVFGLILAAPVSYSLFASPEEVLPSGSAVLLFSTLLFQYLCWQLLYILISRDPAKHRIMMIPAFLALIANSFYSLWWYGSGFPLGSLILVVQVIIACTFIAAFWSTGREKGTITA